MKLFTISASLDRELQPSPEMKDSVTAMEKIVGHNFKNKRLLEEALTHSSITYFPSYKRLAVLGDAALGLAMSNHLFLAYPNMDQCNFTELRSANVSRGKFACAAVKHGFYGCLRHRSPALDNEVREFAREVSIWNGKNEPTLVYDGAIQPSRVLAEIVEAVAAAVYIDLNFDLDKLWMPSWELELDALLQSTTGEAGSSAAPAEPAGAMPEAEVFVKLREVLSLTASQALRCQGLDSVGECLNDLASGGYLSPEGISFLTDLLERTRHHFLIFERALQAEDDLKVAKVAQEAGRVELEAIKARKAKLIEFDRQISDLERQISDLRQQRSAAASELEKDFEANKARLTAFAAGARRIQQLQCNKKTRQAEIILSEAKWLELKAALETFLPLTP
ncbi:uncharacterized protein LOC125468472 isoform X2 [Pyrus x bretschneideri]|uniref:uncharacterized protein LOC125468472 isoform X2 n=1 Tax=Pyrus x bretschneideri TaxID=225117 RepID=UPI002030456D|nr:uncharacterized protein LOC125468472 isoform X2 [Pyrus x bretschneideri]